MDLFNDLPQPKDDINLSSSKVVETETEEKKINQKNKRSLEEDLNAPNEELKRSSSNAQTLDLGYVEKPESLAEPLEKKLDTINLKAFFAERQGERANSQFLTQDAMQDRHVIIEDFTKHIKTIPVELTRLCYFAVFDGHAGSRASSYCAENMHKILADKLSKAFSNKTSLEQTEKEIKRYFVETFRQCDDEFLKIAANNKPVWKDGTTATVILIINQTLYAANCGDSKAIIYGARDASSVASNKSDFIIELTREHSASVYEERQRIQKSGGSVKDGRVLGVLEVSRSIGDGALKAYGVTCVPDMRKCQLNSFYKFIIIACDGLWKTFSNEEAVNFVNTFRNKCLEQNESTTTFNYETVCNKIAIESLKRLSADNVTVMIVSISEATKIRQV